MKLIHMFSSVMVVNIVGLLWILAQLYTRTSVLQAKEKDAVKAERVFTKMNFGSIYILGATGGNTSDNASWDIFKVYASVDVKAISASNISCCLMYRDGRKLRYFKVSSLKTKIHPIDARLRTIHLTCRNVKYAKAIVPEGIGLTTVNLTCSKTHVRYVEPFFPMQEQNSKLALCTQVAFGNLSAELIIEWLETYKYLGVDKVITYYLNNLNNKALNVLDHYSKSGVLDLYPYAPAASDQYDHNLQKKGPQTFNDLTMVVLDSFERMSGYQYFGIIDFDEFLIPSQNRSLKEMLADLYDEYPEAAGFIFKTQYFYLSWEETGNTNDLLIARYITRPGSLPRLDRPKNLYMPKYISFGGARTHKVIPVGGRRVQNVPAEDGFIRHFRKCRGRAKRSTSNCFNFTRVTDTTMAKWTSHIEEAVYQVRKRIFGTEKAIS